MRRKSARNAQKATPEKPVKEAESPPKRRSRRRKRSPSKSSESEDEVLTVTKRAPLEETPDTTTKSHTPTDEEVSEEAVWKVTSSEDSPKGEIQKLKLCLTRPSPAPDSPDKSKLRRSKSNSQTEDDTTSSEDKTGRRTRSKGSPIVRNDGLTSQEGDEDVEEKKGKGKSKGKHKSKIGKSPHLSQPEQQTNNEISENVQVTPQSPSIDKPVDCENDYKVDADDIQKIDEIPENVIEESDIKVGRDPEEKITNKIVEETRDDTQSKESDDEPLSVIQKTANDSKKITEEFVKNELSTEKQENFVAPLSTEIQTVEKQVVCQTKVEEEQGKTNTKINEEQVENETIVDKVQVNTQTKIDKVQAESPRQESVETEESKQEKEESPEVEKIEEATKQEVSSNEREDEVKEVEDRADDDDMSEVVSLQPSKDEELEEDTLGESVDLNKSCSTNVEDRPCETIEKDSPKVEEVKKERVPRLILKRDNEYQFTETKNDSSETGGIKPANIKRKWGCDENAKLLKIDLESIQTVWSAIDFPEEPDLHLDIERERRKSLTDSIGKKLERKVSVEYKSDNSEKPSFEKQSSVNSATKDSEDDNSNIIAFNRKISIVDDTASKLRPPPSPAKNSISNILFITNLVRPFTVKQLKELLERTGKIREEGFWTDRIKSKCYVQYETQEEAEVTRNALHGVQWPIGNGKKLIIDYATEEDMENAKNPPAAPTTPVADVKITAKENSQPEEVKSRPEEKIVKDEEKRREAPVREWDIGKKDIRRDRSRSRERSRKHKRSTSPSEDFISKKQRKSDESMPQKLMDDLFLKTKATPSIYWQPLSPEEISMKQQQRLIRMEEHKRRMEENSRMKGRDLGRGAFRRRYD